MIIGVGLLASPLVPIDTHEWISFEDNKTQRTWVFDATFLRSKWSCIFGSGCKGVLDEDGTALSQGCCSYGAHFGDKKDLEKVLKFVPRLKKRHWQYKKKGEGPKGFLAKEDGATTTRLVDGACIFLNRPGFEGGAGCAFHIAALEAGERPLDWKPDVCWQLPLRLEDSIDEFGYVTTTIREWKRRDWGEGGADFHWWCTETDEAFVGGVPVYQYLRDELTEMVGAKVYAQLLSLIHRDEWVPLPHPAIKRGPLNVEG